MPHVPDTDSSRLRALDGLRGLACLGIVALHVWMFDYGDAGRGPKSLLDVAAGELRLGVPLFFVLSGFLVYRPFAAAALDGRRAPRLRRYMRKRAARILPGYWAAVLGVFTLLTAIGAPQAVPAQRLPIFLAFLQTHVAATGKRLDPPMWSVCVEVSFYLLAPLVGLLAGRLGGRRPRQLALTGGLLALGALVVALAAHGRASATANATLAHNLTPFACGMGVAVLLHGRRLSRRAGVALGLAGVALLLADASWHGGQLGAHEPRALVADLPACLGFGLLIAALTASPVRVRALDVPPLSTAGTLSYGIYLWHFPAIYALRNLDRWPRQLGVAYAATLGLAIAAAWLSWRILERPAIRWAERSSGPAADSPRPHTAGAAAGLSHPPTEAAWAPAPGRT
jgi:peptidoglycan/LPS O-acetylase OafA/YrhL